MRKGFYALGLLILSMLVLSFVACASPSSAGSGTIRVYVTDAVPAGVTAVEIKASDVQVHKAGDADGQWITVLASPPLFDLVKATGVNVLLGTSNLTAGNCTQVRLNITDVKVTIAGKQVQATVPSTELKLVGNITIEEGKQTSVSLDFDGNKSVVLEGQDRVSLKPVAKLVVGQPGATLATPTATP